jgi:hypothetical protein
VAGKAGRGESTPVAGVEGGIATKTGSGRAKMGRGGGMIEPLNAIKKVNFLFDERLDVVLKSISS